MGDFLAFVPKGDRAREGERSYRGGLASARDLTRQVPRFEIVRNWAMAAAFPRMNGTCSTLARDPRTDSWCFTVGTWFHARGSARGDEPVLLERYQEVGAFRLARELEGFFLVVIGDGRSREVVVITDPLGTCHGVMRGTRAGVALSCSAWLLAGLEDFELDPVGCQEFLNTGTVYEDRTVYREVTKLAPASVYRFGRGERVGKDVYWHPRELEPESLDGEGAVEALGNELMEAARRVERVFRRPVCDLTGGYDSRLVVAMFHAAGVPFTATVSGPAASPDVLVSRGLARKAGLPHVYTRPRTGMTISRLRDAFELTHGDYDLVDYARILADHRQLSHRFDVSVNGGCGEFGSGIWWSGVDRDDRECTLYRHYARGVFDSSLYPPDIRLSLDFHFTRIIESAFRELAGFPATTRRDHANLLLRAQRWYGGIATSTNRHWPCLTPYLFRSVLEVMLQTRADFRRNQTLKCRVMEAHRPGIARFPMAHTLGRRPLWWLRNRLAERAGAGSQGMRRERGHARLQLWKEEEVRELLRPDRLRLAPLLDGSAVKTFLERSRTARFEYEEQWARLLTLEYGLERQSRRGGLRSREEGAPSCAASPA